MLLGLFSVTGSCCKSCICSPWLFWDLIQCHPRRFCDESKRNQTGHFILGGAHVAGSPVLLGGSGSWGWWFRFYGLGWGLAQVLLVGWHRLQCCCFCVENFTGLNYLSFVHVLSTWPLQLIEGFDDTSQNQNIQPHPNLWWTLNFMLILGSR